MRKIAPAGQPVAYAAVDHGGGAASHPGAGGKSGKVGTSIRVGFAEDRAAFALNLASVARRSGKEPTLAVRLTRSASPPATDAPFSLYRPPSEAALILSGLDFGLLSSLHADLQLRLRPGRHSIPLAQGSPAEFEFGQDSDAQVRLEISREAGRDRRPSAIVRRFDVRFERPVVIHNVLHALSEVRTLFEDRTVGAVLQRIPAEQAWAGLRALLPERLRSLGGLFEESNSLGVVVLDRVEGRARYKRRTSSWDMRVGFSGRLNLPGGVVRPFNDTELPNVVLPSPHALLDQLFSDQPLASAELAGKKGATVAFLRAVLGAAIDASGKIALTARLPLLRMATTLVAGSEIEARLRLCDEVTIEGPFKVRLGERESVLDIPRLNVRLPDDGFALKARALLKHDLVDGPKGYDERFSLAMDLAFLEGSRIPRADLVLTSSHPLCVGRREIPLRLTSLRCDGEGKLEFADGALSFWPTARRVRLAGLFESPGAVQCNQVGVESRTSLKGGRFDGALELDPDGSWKLHSAGTVQFAHTYGMAITAVPELAIEEGRLRAVARGQASFTLDLVLNRDRQSAPLIDFDGTAVEVVLDEAQAMLGERTLLLPRATSLSLRVTAGCMTAVGLAPVASELTWDLHQEPCLLRAGGREVSLLSHGLRRGRLTLCLRGGRFELEGDAEGLYGVRFFNALLDPTAHLDTWLDVLRSEEALNRVIAAIQVFAPELAWLLTDLRSAVLSVRAMLAREGIRTPGDLIPRPRLVRFLSLLLVGNDSLSERLELVVRQVTEGRGLPVRELKAILNEQLEELRYDYEIDWIVRWLDLLLRPSAPLSRPVPKERPSLAEDPEFAEAREGLPSAAQLYRRLLKGLETPAQAAELARLAPYLSLSQLEWLCLDCAAQLDSRSRGTLLYARELKRRVRGIADAYGGVRFAPQATSIATLLGEAGLHAESALRGEKPDGLAPLGPEEVATLLQAGLATGRQGRRTQANNRLLIDMMRAQPAAFTLEVLIELGNESPRALSGALFAFLAQDQEKLRDPIDLAAFLEQRLGLPVPRKGDYEAGGVRARRSYTEALDSLAAKILARSGPYLSCKAHLQTVRHQPAGVPHFTSGSGARLVARAEAAIATAERLGARCRFRATPKGERARAAETRRRAEAVAAFEAAFEACRALLRHTPQAVSQPWLKRFWAANEEALVVRSVVSNYVEDLDRVRYWLHRRLIERESTPARGLPDEEAALRALARRPIKDRQELVDAVIDVLYAAESDRKDLKRSPLVRLLIDPPEGRYDFTIVSAMGVITEGARGRELEDAYRRLWSRRGVRTMRADTATGRSLEYNAARVHDVVRQITTPWGYLGYSQGCANGLFAEGLLRAGTPSEQRLLGKFVSRKLLFSAANGSAHGTSGMRKLALALVQGECSLKPYQATFSRPATEAFYRVVRALLDSRAFVHAMGGGHSLTFERAIALHRDLQVVEHAVTSTTRGVAEEPFVPEVLEYMSNLLDLLQPGVGHDTQVVVDDARGEAAAVLNDWARALGRVNIDSRVQSIHHWSPVSYEAEFVTTCRDRARAIYDGPKDRHVFPWVEVNARFGRIPVQKK